MNIMVNVTFSYSYQFSFELHSVLFCSLSPLATEEPPGGESHERRFVTASGGEKPSVTFTVQVGRQQDELG